MTELIVLSSVLGYLLIGSIILGCLEVIYPNEFRNDDTAFRMVIVVAWPIAPAVAVAYGLAVGLAWIGRLPSQAVLSIIERRRAGARIPAARTVKGGRS